METGKNMKIAFDAQLLLKGEKTGIAWCAENVLMEFAKENETEKYLNFFSLGYKEEDKLQAGKYKEKGYRLQECRWFHDVLYRMGWNFIPIPYSFFFGKKADVTVFFNYAIPPGVKGKKVVFIHDMAYKAYPETVRAKTRNFLEMTLQKSCQRADKIVTISEFSKSEIIKYLKVEEKKIEVVPLGVDFGRFHTGYTEKQKQKVAEKYKIPSDYFLYLGTIEPRKNIKRILKAYALFNKESELVPHLVLAGRKGWLYESIFAAVEELKLQEKVHFLGYVDSEDVPVLLSGAELFLFPSLYEGFGLPVLEAMACGVPVITSNVASMPEIAGDAAVLVNPLEITQIKEGISLVFSDLKKREYLLHAGIEQTKKYTWEKTAKKLRDILEM